MFGQYNQSQINNSELNSSFKPKIQPFLKSDTDFIITDFQRTSTLLAEDIESVLQDIEKEENEDREYEAWKRQLEQPQRKFKVRGLKINNTEFLTGHLIPLKRNKTSTVKQNKCDKKVKPVKVIDSKKLNRAHSENKYASEYKFDGNKYHNVKSFSQQYFNSVLSPDQNKYNLIPYITRQFNRLNVVQPAIHKMKTFLHTHQNEYLNYYRNCIVCPLSIPSCNCQIMINTPTPIMYPYYS